MAASQAASQLQQPAPAAGTAPPLAMSSLLSSVALHSLRASCLTLQKLLLLLGYISHIGSLGSAPLTAADHAALAAELIAPLTTALRSVAAALWLCKTPASTPVPGLLAGLRATTGWWLGCCADLDPYMALLSRIPAIAHSFAVSIGHQNARDHVDWLRTQGFCMQAGRAAFIEEKCVTLASVQLRMQGQLCIYGRTELWATWRVCFCC